MSKSRKNSHYIRVFINISCLLLSSTLSGLFLREKISLKDIFQCFVIGPIFSCLFTFVFVSVVLNFKEFRLQVYDFFTDFSPSFPLLPKEVIFGVAIILTNYSLIILSNIIDPLKYTSVIILGYFGGFYAKEIRKLRGSE